MAANSNEYIKEAVNELEVISQDEMKRMEYNARQKAIWDYNTLMEENFFRGMEKGREERENEIMRRLKALGLTESQIREALRC